MMDVVRENAVLIKFVKILENIVTNVIQNLRNAGRPTHSEVVIRLLANKGKFARVIRGVFDAWPMMIKNARMGY